MVDITTYALLATSFFFVALSFALLSRYRKLSQTISTSTELGRDLWESLEQRLRKQDERILDMMGRLEVIQSRIMTAAALQQPTVTQPPPETMRPVGPAEERAVAIAEPTPHTRYVAPPESQQSRQSQQGSQPTQPPSITSIPTGEFRLDETQLAAIGLLGQGPKNTRELTDALKKSREHTARIMKELFERGFVKRNDSSKPFVYELTEEGRSNLPQGQANN